MRIGKSRASGFTLVELMVVLVLIALLAGIVTPIIFKSIHRAKESTLKENLFILRKAIDDYYTDTASYPAEIEVLVEKRYLRRIPVDPLTERSNTWILVRTEGEGDDNGIIDIHSGAEEKSSDDMLYRDW